MGGGGSMEDVGSRTPGDRRGTAAFTLAEMLIASAVLLMTLGATLTAMMMYRRAADLSGRHMRAVHESRRVLEQVTAHDFYHARLQPGRHLIPSDWGAQGAYEVILRDPRTKDIEVTVTWSAPWRDRVHEVQIATSMSESLHP